jgi:hypothetical protein
VTVGNTVGVAVTVAVEVAVAVGEGVGVSTPLTTRLLAQSSTSIPSASCATTQTLLVHTPGSEIFAVNDIVVLAPTA